MKVFLLCLFPLLIKCANVLFLPSSFFPSHSIPMRSLANNLINKGHSVSWIEYGPTKSSIDLHSSIQYEHWEVSIDEPILNDLFVNKNSSIQPWNPKEEGDTISISAWIASIRICDRLLTHDKKRFEGLINQKYDTIILDDQYNPCGLLLSSLSGSVFIYWSQSLLRPESAWSHHSPSPPSYIPVPGTKLTDTLSFYERSINLAYYMRSLYIHQQIIQTRIDKMFQRHYPSVVSSFDMERNASLNFINSPPIFDFARPFMPRVVFVGCIHCRKAQKLNKEISSFIGDSQFMVASFGYESYLSKAPQNIRQMFFNALSSRSSIKFIVQYNGKGEIPSNVLTLPFIPLQDLLGNSQCIGHISHGGINSITESVWNAIPIIGIPLLYPSHDNLLRITARGCGLIVEKKDLSLHSLTRAIDSIQKKKYKDEMIVFQDMIRDVPYTELDHATFWVEFIERHHEIPHARSGADHLNIIQYFLIDVIVFIMSMVYIFAYIIFSILKFIIGLVSISKKNQSKKKNKKE